MQTAQPASANNQTLTITTTITPTASDAVLILTGMGMNWYFPGTPKTAAWGSVPGGWTDDNSTTPTSYNGSDVVVTDFLSQVVASASGAYAVSRVTTAGSNAYSQAIVSEVAYKLAANPGSTLRGSSIFRGSAILH